MADDKRSDYLKSLNKMRDGYQNSGNPMINTQDDSTNVGEELSSFAYMNTDVASAGTQGNNRNGWQKITDTFESPRTNIGNGVLNFLDDIFDFAVSAVSWITGLVSGTVSSIQGKGWEEGWNSGTDWASDVIQYDWQSQATQLFHQLSVEGLMSGDVFNGEQWQAIGSAEASKREEESRAGNSWQNSWGDFGNTVKNVEEGIGYMLPSVVAGFATGGESLVAQASVQAGISAASGYGRSVESALDDGADYDRAMAYAAAKGGAEGAASFATTFIGGNVAAKTGGSAVSNLGSTVGKQVYAKTGNATAKIIAAKATELVAQAGISYTKAFAKTMAEPAFKRIYDDDAIKEAYGSDEGLSRTLSMAQSNALMASVTTAVVGVAKEGTKLAIEGKDAYRAEFLMEEAYRDSVKYCNEMKRYANEYKQEIDDIDKRVDSNQLSQAEGDKLKNAAKEALIEKTGKIQAKLETTAKNIQDAQDMIKPGLDKESAKKTKLNETQLTEEDVAKKNDEIKEALKEKWSEDSKKDLKNLKNKKYAEYNKQNGITNETVAENYINKTRNLGDTLSRLKMAFSADEIKREASGEVITKSTTRKIIESVFSENQPYDDISEQIIRTYLGEDGKYETLDKALTDLNDRVKFMKDFKFGMTDEGEVYSESKTDSIRKITYGDNGKMNSVVIRTEKGTEEIKVKNGKLVADSPKKLAEIASALSESKINGGLSVSSDAKTASVPEVASESVTTVGKKITLSDNAMRQIASSDELPKAIMNADYSKSYMLGQSDGTAISVQPLSDGSGKSVIMEIDGKSNEAKSVRIGSARELSDRVAKKNYIVIPKKDLDRIEKTKAVDKATGKPITADVIGMESYGDGYATLGIRQTTGNWEKDSAAGFFVYSKRPLYSNDFEKKVTFGKVVAKLGVSESLSKTYAIKTAQGADKAIDWLKKVTGLETNELFSRLGYDSYINEKENEITTFDYSNIINQGAKVDYGEKGLLLDDGKAQNGKDDVGSGQERDVARRIAEDDRWNESESLENAKTRLGYATEVREAGGYTKVEGFNGKKFCVIKDEFLAPELRELKDLGDNLGASVFFVLSNAEDETMDGAVGFYQSLTDEIYVSIDNISDSSVRNAAMHEIGHALFEMNGLEEKYGIKAKILEGIANGDKELSGIFKNYVRIWNYDGKNHSAWLESAGSDVKPIDLTSEFDEQTIDLIAEEMSNQIYVGEEVLHGKNVELADYIKESYDESLNEGNEEELALENDMYDYYGDDSEEYDLEITNGQESLLKKAPQSADDKSKYNEEVSINPDFEPMQAHAKVEFNKDKNKWDVEITDKYTNRTLPTVSFKTKGSAERWLERRAGKDGKIIRTYSNEGANASKEKVAPKIKTDKIDGNLSVGVSKNKKTAIFVINGKKSVVKMGEIKIGNNGKMVKDSNSKPFFDVAEIYNKKAVKEFPSTKESFESVSKEYNVSLSIMDDSGNKLDNPSMKSIGSLADRIKRNIEEKGDANPNHVKDLIRGTLIYNDDSKLIDNLPKIIESLYEDGFDFVKIESKNGPYYKGEHINLRKNGVAVEIQLHTEDSWESKKQGDLFYDKYRSIKNPLKELKGENLERYIKERDEAKKNALKPLENEAYKKVYDFIPNLANSSSLKKFESHTAPTVKSSSSKGTHLPSTSSSTGHTSDIDNLTTLPSGNIAGRNSSSDISGSSSENNPSIATNEQNSSVKKVVKNIERKSAANLIESGADVSKPTKVRLKDVKEAFTTALDETIPENSKAHISFQSVKDTFAEVNLAKKKDLEDVASNILARIKDTKVTITTEDGDETLKLGDMMTDEQANQALDIVNNAIKGKAQATELSKWAKSLSIEKIKGKENIKTFKLVSAIEKKVQSGSKEYLSAPGVAPMELSTYSKIIEGIKGPLTGATLTKLAENVIAVYNDAFSDMLAGYGIESNDMLVPMAEMLMQEAGSGAQATEKGLVLANQILDSVSKEMTNLKKGIKSSNYEKARDGVVLAQAGFGIIEKPQGKGAALRFASKVKSVAASLDYHVRSPINILTGVLGENHPYVVHLADGGKACENAQAKVLAKWKDKLFGKEALGGKSTEWLQRELRKKTDFKGEKITVGQAIKIINTSRTAKSKDDFLKRGISFKINGKRADFLDISKEELQALEDAIPEELAKWNDDVVMPFLNGDCKTYIEGKYKTISGVELKMNDGIYYPTSAIGDKATDIAGNSKGSINPNDWGLSFFKERVKGTVAPYNANGDVLSDLVGYIQKVSQWGEWSQWYKTLRIMEDTRAFGVGTSLNAILSKNVEGWDVLNDFIHKSALGISFGEGKGGLMKQIDSAVGGLFSNIQQVAMMDIFTQIKTLGSDFTGWQFFGAKDVIQGIINYYANGGPVGEKHAREVIEKYSPTLKMRFATSEAISANLGKEIKNGVVIIGTTPVRILDAHIHLKAFFMAQVQARRELGPNATQDEIDERTVRILEKYSDTTQPTTSKFRVAMYRSGYDGQIVKQVFGMFQSMGQNIYQGFYDVTKGRFNQITIMKNYEDAIKYYDDRIALYAKTEEENREKANDPNLGDKEKEAFSKKADEAKYHKEGNERSKQTVNETLNKMRGKYTWKNYVNKAAGFLAGLIGSGLVLTLISNVKNMTYGNKEWDDWDAKEIAEDTAYQSFVNWIPIVGTIANSIKNDSDLTVFTIDNLNSFINASKEMIQSFGEGNGTRATGKTLAFLMQAATLFGIPAQSIWKLANGIWYNVDKESNLNFRASLGFLSANSIKTNYSDALKKGQSSKAIANIDVWMSMYSANSGKEVASEIYRLNRLGISNVAPSAVPSTYTDGSGEKVALTQAQSDAFRQMYSKGGSQAKSLIASSLYQSLDDEYKGKALKQLYSAYAQAAKYKAYGASPTSKIGKLLAQTNGDLELARYIAALQSLGGKTKNDAVKAVNKLSGFTKAEKLLVMWMNGYKLTDANARILVNWLVSKGSSSADASALINS